MPYILTHYHFYRKVNDKKVDIGFLGTQGPDPFFNYGHTVRKTKKAKEVRKFGTTLHETDEYNVLRYFIEYIEKITNKEDKEILKAYLNGVVAHYVLDSTTHPYIYYFAGFPKTDNKEENDKYFIYHTRIESGIDVLISHYFKNAPLPYQVLFGTKHELEIISIMWHELAKNVFKNKYIGKKSFAKSVKHMIFNQKILNDATGARKKLFDENFADSKLSSMSLDRYENIKIDYLNLRHRPFKDVVTGIDPKTTDFISLFNRASKKYEEFIALIDNIFDKKANIEDLKTLTNEINHNGIKVGEKMQYFDCMFEK